MEISIKEKRPNFQQGEKTCCACANSAFFSAAAANNYAKKATNYAHHGIDNVHI